MKKIISVGMVAGGLVFSQPPAQAPAKPDSDAVKALIEKAKKAGGPMWAGEEHFFCEAPRANSPSDPPIEPTKIFDNVYVIGNQGTVVYVIETSDGLLMIDSLGANQVESQLLPGFQKLGFHLVGPQGIDHQQAVRSLDDVDHGSLIADHIDVIEDFGRLDRRV